MKPIQVVIDTNVMVSATRSARGAAFILLQHLPDRRFEINLSQALLLEYEEKLKQVTWPRGPAAVAETDRFLDYLVLIANKRRVTLSLGTAGIPEDDHFVVDLAIASKAPYIITYNIRHFVRAGRYGIEAIRPWDFLKVMEDLS